MFVGNFAPSQRRLDNAPSVTVTLDMLTVVLLVSSILYILCLILARRKLSFLQRVSPELTTKKLLVLSVTLVCFVRVLSFIGVAAMDIANVRAHYSLKPVPVDESGIDKTKEDTNQSFYDASMTVLFDLPNAIVVSTYVLLALVWAECFLQSRFHTESTMKWKTRWLTGYMIFNSALYSTQLILYVLIFWPGTSQSVMIVRTVLYVAMTGINWGAVLLVAALYIYLSMKFSGFPFRSQHAMESLSKISNVMLLWSLSRVVWGIAMLVVYCENIVLLQDSKTPLWSSLVLLLLLVFCEICPICCLLDYSYMNIIGFERGAARDMNALASGLPFLSVGNEEEHKEDTSWHEQQIGAFPSDEPLLQDASDVL